MFVFPININCSFLVFCFGKLSCFAQDCNIVGKHSHYMPSNDRFSYNEYRIRSIYFQQIPFIGIPFFCIYPHRIHYLFQCRTNTVAVCIQSTQSCRCSTSHRILSDIICHNILTFKGQRTRHRNIKLNLPSNFGKVD